jgi:mannose/cellobiose epimerase-like protein (N-acyl-D-glucosamine 2-epimerase family)
MARSRVLIHPPPQATHAAGAGTPGRMSAKSHAAVRRAYQPLRRWLLQEAYPLWSAAGWDPIGGGFHERLAPAGPVLTDARRARVQLRQIYSFARAAPLGWSGEPRPLVTDGLEHVYAHYRRADGLFRALLGPDGVVREERALLYDQAFALLALAEAHRLLGPAAGCARRAVELLDRITQRLGSLEAFRTDTDSGADAALLANPHMHLLEAALAWVEVDGAPRWRRLAEGLVRLALERWIDPASGVLRERYEPMRAGAAQRTGLIEPGHQFEWAGLLLRFDAASAPLRAAALRLVQIGEEHGVRDGFAVNALAEDLTVHDPEARLWPQTERIKALARLAGSGADTHAWAAVAEAAEALRAYLAVTPGLWFDRRRPDGTFVPEPAPASSFYHIIGAIDALGEALEGR